MTAVSPETNYRMMFCRSTIRQRANEARHTYNLILVLCQLQRSFMQPRTKKHISFTLCDQN